MANDGGNRDYALCFLSGGRYPKCGGSFDYCHSHAVVKGKARITHAFQFLVQETFRLMRMLRPPAGGLPLQAEFPRLTSLGAG